jgi:hypothetical protein
MARELAAGRVEAIVQAHVSKEAERLDDELRGRGGWLSTEQRRALELACSDAQFVVIEGQAGTGKSMVLVGVARAHHDQGRQIVVTSTGALAGQHLAGELSAAGVEAEAHSTAALHAALANGRLELGPETTVIHDEAALASTREQHQLMSAVEESGARLILVGDPLQSQPVGAGGLWSEIEQATLEQQVRADLTRNVRALDPDDRRDQARFRAGRHEEAIRGYDGRGRVTITDRQRQAEDAALEAAYADIRDYKRTLVIAQTSNERLDELNARAQAIRREHQELGQEGLPVPGRPFRLYTGDLVQIRHAINHEHLGQIRNGQTGLVIDVDPKRDALRLYLGPDRHGLLDRRQIDRADLRLAYVQHPFPAQGQTTDTVHVIVAERATREGAYVALSRARESAHLYASHQALDHPDEPLAALAEHVARFEPDVPSIHTPLAHELHIQERNGDELAVQSMVDTQQRHAQRSDALGRSPDRALQDGSTQGAEDPLPARLAAALGPRPDPAHPHHAVWRRAAEAVREYRGDYDIPDDDPRLLGSEPTAGAFQQRLDRRGAAQLVHDARQQLTSATIEPTHGRQRDFETRRNVADDADGWEP